MISSIEKDKVRIAVLSNVNLDFVSRNLESDFDVCPPVGYGDIWGHLLNKNSTLNHFNPELIFIIIDIEHLLESTFDFEIKKRLIDEWFEMLSNSTLKSTEYFISDVCFCENTISDIDEFHNDTIEQYWINKLNEKIRLNANFHRFSLKQVINVSGSICMYDRKMWYLGKIPFSYNGNIKISDSIKEIISCFFRVPKKILVLDLDNTLWGGILGEDGFEGIKLSDDGIGSIYKDVQRLIKKMQRHGVMLAICSKNNLPDVEELWKNNSHMILQKSDFVSMRINWQDKVNNILEIAQELNIGLSSFVYLDDMPNERENVKSRLTEVTVPDFPDDVEELPNYIEGIYNQFFRKTRATQEDLLKTQQYLENGKRKIASQGMSYVDFLKSLHLKVKRVEFNDSNKNRIIQLINKTNQFNLTTKRYNLTELENFINNKGDIYAYQVEDKFGDYGIVAVILVDKNIPQIDTFLMSCRIMGKQLENFFLNQIEENLIQEGYEILEAEYVATSKNLPVAKFYDDLGYQRYEEEKNVVKYHINLKSKPKRAYFVNKSDD